MATYIIFNLVSLRKLYTTENKAIALRASQNNVSLFPS